LSTPLLEPTSGALSEPRQPTPGAANLLRGAYALLANTAVTGALGMLFWVSAARLYPASTVGRDTILISVMVELSVLCQLNLGNGIVKFLPGTGRAGPRALAGVYATATLAAVLAGALFVILAPSLSVRLSFIGGDPLLSVVFVAALAAWGIFTLQDAALTATQRTAWLPVENGAFGVLKLALLPVALWVGARNGVFVAWVVPIMLLVPAVNWLMLSRPAPVREPASVDSPLQRMGARRALVFLSQDYAGSVLAQGTVTVLPLLVLALLGPRQSAYFAMPFTIAVAFDTFAYGACAALVVQASITPEHLSPLARVFTRRVLVLLAPAALLLITAAPLVLAPFGDAYASHGTTVLRLLIAASLVRVPLALYAAALRAEGRGVRLAGLAVILLFAALGGTVTLTPGHGIDGAAIAWLAANVLAALAAAPGLLRLLRGS